MKIGDKVSATIQKITGKRISLTVKEGVVVLIGETFITMKLKNGRETLVYKDSVRPIDSQNALTEILFRNEKK